MGSRTLTEVIRQYKPCDDGLDYYKSLPHDDFDRMWRECPYGYRLCWWVGATDNKVLMEELVEVLLDNLPYPPELSERPGYFTPSTIEFSRAIVDAITPKMKLDDFQGLLDYLKLPNGFEIWSRVFILAALIKYQGCRENCLAFGSVVGRRMDPNGKSTQFAEGHLKVSNLVRSLWPTLEV